MLINRGDGFQRVASGTEAREGDLVMANPGSSAKLVYPGGCVTEIKPGGVVTVTDGSSCPKAMLVGDGCENSSDRKDCGYVWWPLAVGAALPLTGFLISRSDTDNNNKGGGGGPSP